MTESTIMDESDDTLTVWGQIAAAFTTTIVRHSHE